MKLFLYINWGHKCPTSGKQLPFSSTYLILQMTPACMTFVYWQPLSKLSHVTCRLNLPNVVDEKCHFHWYNNKNLNHLGMVSHFILFKPPWKEICLCIKSSNHRHRKTHEPKTATLFLTFQMNQSRHPKIFCNQ